MGDFFGLRFFNFCLWQEFKNTNRKVAILGDDPEKIHITARFNTLRALPSAKSQNYKPSDTGAS
jgi:hypothetical protein